MSYYYSVRTGASYHLDSFNSWLGGTKSVRFNFHNFKTAAIRFDKTLSDIVKQGKRVTYVVKRKKIKDKGKYIIIKVE